LAHDLAIPATSNLFAVVSETPAVQTLARRVENGGVLSCTGVSQTAQPFFAALLHFIFPQRPIVVVTEGLKTQESFQEDIGTWLAVESKVQSPKSKVSEGQTSTSKSQPLFYPPWEILPHESRLPHADVISERLETLVSLTHHATRPVSAGQRAPILVTSVSALVQRTFPQQTIAERTRTLARGERIDPLDLVEWLEAQGYEPEAQVTQKGEIALRGGILDIYPITSPWPVRMEFFGDELESLRHFDPLTQISREEISGVTIPPGGELGILKKQPDNLGTLLDYLPQKAIFLLCESEQVDTRAEEYAVQVPPGDPFFISWEEFKTEAEKKGMTLLSVDEGETDLIQPPDLDEATDSETHSVPFQNLDAYRPLAERAPEPQIAEAQRREFFAQLHRWLRQDYAVHVFCNNDGERQRFAEVWEEYGLEAQKPTLHIGTLARGFLYDEGKLVVITDAEIFGRYKVQRPRRLKSAHAQATRSALDIDFAELEEGDYVVHLQHGIGRYLGLQVLPIGLGTKPTEIAETQSTAGQECLVIEYAPNDPSQPPPKLYVPVTEAHLVSKYVGTGKARPPLNTLGGTRWAKAKAQAERAVRDVASELLSIQAARDSQAGHSFATDTPWQREFEGSFIYEETPDQLKAIGETKTDMERPKPMDRLICGDVGFGKTEVGIRAAFKAVMDGKQVAVLVPTTVLAQQHYNTFRERMADYPVRVELLSRFRTRRAQQQVVKELAAGSVDIVIGTHRLLQSDIAFKDLGLVVIDEEQRFGVLHKEKFKMLRKLVDVLTLSATPIPRTLYLALTGARDMSTIQTPPHDRLPVETIVTQYDERVIRDATRRELNRGGQVFFLHNRVMTIDTMAQKLRTLLPDARIVVGHGQMHSDDLEEVMTKFVNGEADVLLSTTIIESGLDIPNANTIIIDRADRFGLSDLYQLRGRVGRYKHQAYAYLLLPRHGGLVADVRKRLSAIKQYSTLGSGFKIAMRDLEIRGAGNLLGAEQSGHITAVGFELYCQLLKQSVASQKGEKVKPRIEVQVRLDFLALSPTEESPKSKVQSAKSDGPAESLPTTTDQASQITHQPSRITHAAFIPFKYISDARQRIEIYRKLAQASDKPALQSLEKEIRDRFGPLPAALQLLLLIGELKILASDRGITAVEVKEDRLMLTRNDDFIMVGSKFPRLTKTDPSARLKEIKKLLTAL
jgi:transcription-repair coupling factor (superfamily II helicase)